MAYHVHKTLGFVLASIPVKEANTFVIVFTRELGLIKAQAQGTQKVASKLRYGLQKFSFSQLSFIYGKHTWKVTNVVPLENIFYLLQEKKEKLLVCAHVSVLLQRFLTGEEKNEELFDLVMDAMLFLGENNISQEDLSSFEYLFVLRILYNLGYISGTGELEHLARGTEWGTEYLARLAKQKKEVVSAINRAISESQL